MEESAENQLPVGFGNAHPVISYRDLSVVPKGFRFHLDHPLVRCVFNGVFKNSGDDFCKHLTVHCQLNGIGTLQNHIKVSRRHAGAGYLKHIFQKRPQCNKFRLNVRNGKKGVEAVGDAVQNLLFERLTLVIERIHQIGRVFDDVQDPALFRNGALVEDVADLDFQIRQPVDLALAAQKSLVGLGVLVRAQVLVQPFNRGGKHGEGCFQFVGEMVDDPFLGLVQDFKVVIQPGVFKGDGDVVADRQEQFFITGCKVPGGLVNDLKGSDTHPLSIDQGNTQDVSGFKMGFLIHTGIKPGVFVSVVDDQGFLILKDPSGNSPMGWKTDLIGFKIC